MCRSDGPVLRTQSAMLSQLGVAHRTKLTCCRKAPEEAYHLSVRFFFLLLLRSLSRSYSAVFSALIVLITLSVSPGARPLSRSYLLFLRHVSFATSPRFAVPLQPPQKDYC